jgi:hypothetical protein
MRVVMNKRVIVVVGGQRSGYNIWFIRSLPLDWNFSSDVFKCFPPIRMKIWMAEGPALQR